MEETSIKLTGNFSKSAYGAVLKHSLDRSLEISHKLPDWILTMPGMSGRKYRSLINTVVENVPAPRYTEVGSWAGSTSCSAMWGNTAAVTCIDNWSEFDGPRDAFIQHTNQARSENISFDVIEEDFRKIAWADRPKSNVYLFDGPHTEADQYDGIAIAQPALDNLHILIVDDYNWPAVRNGTLRAVNDLNLDVECSVEIRTTQDNSTPTVQVHTNSDWHNGYFIAVMRKQ